MKAILTVIGKDNIGIVAGVSAELARLNINILDMSQTIMDGHFTMIIMCDLQSVHQDFNHVKESLQDKEASLGVKINIQREEIFTAMHKL